MSPSRRRARKWTCAECGVSVSRIDGEAVPLPDAWTSSAEGLFCLSCRRERAANAALDAAASDSPVSIRAKLRRAALIEFEVSRTPEHPDGTIARACHTSATVVTQARRRLGLPDPPPPSKASRAKHRAAAGR